MLINDLAKKYDISTRTLRYYEELDLIKSDRDNRNIRVYKQASIQRLEMILLFKHLNLSLSEIKCLFQDETTNLANLLNQQLTQLDQSIMDLSYKRSLIQTALRTYTDEDLSQLTLKTFLEEQVFLRSNEKRWLQMNQKEIRLEIGEGLIAIAMDDAPLLSAIKDLRNELKEKHKIEMDMVRVRDMTDLSFEEIRILIGDDIILNKEIKADTPAMKVDQIISHLKSVVL